MIWLTDFYIPLISLENSSREKNAENKNLTVQHFKLLITQLIIAFLDIFFPFSSFIWLFNISVTYKSITSYQKSAVSGVLLTMCESETKQNFIRTFPNRRDYKLLQAEIQNVSNNNHDDIMKHLHWAKRRGESLQARNGKMSEKIRSER